MSGAGKLQLSENHRRVVSALLRGLEQMGESIAAWLEKRPSHLVRLHEELTPQQRARLRELLEQLRAELGRLDSEIELQPVVDSPRRAIRALLSAAIIELEEHKPARLTGYGPLTEPARARLDAEIGRLIALLEKMERVAA